MQLTVKQIESITKGAVYVTEEAEGILFHRFTEDQEKLFQEERPWHYYNTKSPAGVKLQFTTDSETLFVKIKTEMGESRQFFSLEVFVDGKEVGSLQNYDEKNSTDDYAHGQFPDGEYQKEFLLGNGNKTVCVYLPWSLNFYLKEFSLTEGATFSPIKTVRKLLVFGDSITQGYDALKSHHRYAARLSEALSAEEINKAIGGENFFPKLAEISDDIKPDYVTVAYGTNDWCIRERSAFEKNCKDFYEILSAKYSQAKIFAITPIWRINHNEDQKMGPFTLIEETIRKVVEPLPNVIFIRGFELVPGNVKYFADGRVHPNDKGFDYYFKNLYEEIKKYL